MSERGVFAIDRGIWDHPTFANEPLTEREAWIWLIGEASFKARTRRIGSAVIELKRGQLAASLRFMAEKWGWTDSRVRRFLERLKIDSMIGTATDAGVTVVTVSNYNKYQRVSLPSDAARDAQSDAAATQERRKVEDREDKETLSVAYATASDRAPIYTDSRHELWGEGVPILISLGVPEKQARSMIGSWLKLTKDDAQSVLGAIQRARDHRAHNPIPWITNSLKVQHERSGSVFPNPASQQSGSAAVLAGVAAAADRRARQRNAAGHGGPISGNDDPTERIDPEPFRTG
ncbi:hypothetical protein H8B02_22755 [Bradyrhizobium sp. Pear77]|uniref:hypothetical protein n=1 Tax=Bradyrhizobium altum TaxID=1571202 RepID=UPI001E4B3654|nr:hypothetical protein [Bradyrhizobium altum]MCC8956146.1 hypothetical protein [Bradyrhizobium altum]